MHHRSHRLASAVAIAFALASMAAVPADARRGGSFGSRGSRTYYAPSPTYGTNRPVAPIERSMTPRAQPSPGYDPGFAQQQPYRTGSRFGGFGGGLLGGLVAGGLLGHFLGGGSGWGGGGWGAGGGGGLLASLIQIAILGGIVWLVVGFFRRRSGGAGPAQGFDGGFVPQAGGSPWGGAAAQPQPYADPSADIALDRADQADFERLLIDVQDAFGREDYARLRQLTTPEVMSYLSEELSQNATRGVRNSVTGTRLLDAEVSEAWHEAGVDYATIVLRYESIDVMRDRASNAVVGGSADTPTETTELWTFVRDATRIWKLSAIQEG